MRVLVCANPSRDVDNTFTQRAVTLLQTLGAHVSSCLMTDDKTLSQGDYELVIVLGGDGTILRVAPYAAKANACLLGINIGSVGYLSAFGRDNLERGITQALNGELIVENRTMLEISGLLVINEVVMYRGLNPRPIIVSTDAIGVNHFNFTGVKGDGIIIATSTGSTAYSKAAGGIITDATSDSILYTPICSENSTPQLLDGVETIIMCLEGEGYASISIDGREPTPIQTGEKVIIKKSNIKLKLLKSN